MAYDHLGGGGGGAPSPLFPSHPHQSSSAVGGPVVPSLASLWPSTAAGESAMMRNAAAAAATAAAAAAAAASTASSFWQQSTHNGGRHRGKEGANERSGHSKVCHTCCAMNAPSLVNG